MKAEFDQFGLNNRRTCQYSAVGMTYFRRPTWRILSPWFPRQNAFKTLKRKIFEADFELLHVLLRKVIFISEHPFYV